MNLVTIIALFELGENENWTNTGKNKWEKAGPHSHNKQAVIKLHTNYNFLECTTSKKSLPKKFYFSKLRNQTNAKKAKQDYI